MWLARCFWMMKVRSFALRLIALPLGSGVMPKLRFFR
jgi:hypothetical protein